MKICIDCRMIGSGGIGSYISALLPFFIKNFDCVLLGDIERLSQYKTNSNIEILDCKIKTFSLIELFLFPKELSAKINSCELYYSPYFNIPSGIKIPIFSTIHDVVFLDVKDLTSKMGVFLRKIFYKYGIFKSKLIFTVSEFSKSRILANLKCKKDIIVTYNSVPDWFSKKDETVNKTDTVLFVGNIKKHKGLKTLIEAFCIAKQKGLTSQLVIVGNSENFRTGYNTISDLINKLPKEYIKFTGRISDEELKLLYQQAKLLIQPSLYEGLGMPPMESINLGTNGLISYILVFLVIYKDYLVIYFQSENEKDLAEKIISNINTDKPKNIPNIYSFEKTYNIIEKTIKSYFGDKK